jgi:hypothetical protein
MRITASDELEEIWMEAFVITLRYYSSICTEEMRKPANSSNGILHKRAELKLRFSEHEEEVKCIEPRYSTVLCISSNLFIYYLLWLYSPLLGLCRFFSFLILYTVGSTPWTGDQPDARPLPTHRINAHNTDIHTLSGIQTHDANVRAGKDSSCLRPRGHCDRLYLPVTAEKYASAHIGFNVTHTAAIWCENKRIYRSFKKTAVSYQTAWWWRRTAKNSHVSQIGAHGFQLF